MDMIHCHFRLSLDITGLPFASIFIYGQGKLVSCRPKVSHGTPGNAERRPNDISKLTLAHAFFVGKGELVTQRCHVGSRRCE
jgi:hypothetical protein